MKALVERPQHSQLLRRDYILPVCSEIISCLNYGLLKSNFTKFKVFKKLKLVNLSFLNIFNKS